MTTNKLYLFVKGRSGRGAFEITDAQFNPLYEQIVEPLLTKIGEKLSPCHTDLKAIEAGLEYIKLNRGKNGLPQQPVIFIFTTYENNYHIAAGLKEAHKEPLKNFKKNLDSLKLDLKRSGIHSNDDIKFYWIPDDFENRITNVNELLNGGSSSPRLP
jgi:hypothetical protein